MTKTYQRGCFVEHAAIVTHSKIPRRDLTRNNKKQNTEKAKKGAPSQRKADLHLTLLYTHHYNR